MFHSLTLTIAPQHWSMIDEILRRCLPDHPVWAYGSRVTGHSWRYSDLDLVVVGGKPAVGQRDDMERARRFLRIPPALHGWT